MKEVTSSHKSRDRYSGFQPNDWVRVEGTVEFLYRLQGERENGVREIFAGKLVQDVGFNLKEYGHNASHITVEKQNVGEDMSKKYQVILHKCDDGYTVECPEIPGCFSEGDTEEEALENIKEAIKGCLDAREQLGYEDRLIVKTIEV
ncbi:type II toxin-antitoxin system HicB family antitoxin [Alicyclobacillus tolerans]|uniref:type II toxin-antitoxin system HicB family antitoxin n=1 Tax=Alicyclobacillus tolerans TaxID=90970 RepID=UPI003B7E6EB9